MTSRLVWGTCYHVAHAMSRAPECVYVVLALILGLLYTFVTPPFRVPDEVGHFWRACAIAEGDVAPEEGAYLPREDEQFVAATWQKRITPRMALKVRRERNEVAFVRFPTTYTPSPYVPQAAACFFARCFAISPGAKFYLGRLANLILAIVVTAIAIRIMPFAKWTLAVVGLFPMTLFLDASFSPDPLTIALTFILTAILMRGGSGAIVAFLLALCKQGYFLIALLRRRWMTLAVAAPGAMVSLMFSVRGSLTNRPAGVDSRRQIEYEFRHPLSVLSVLAMDAIRHGPRYGQEMIGRLGLLDVSLPSLAIFSAAAVLIATMVWAGGTPDRGTRMVATALAAMFSLAVLFSLYVTWTPVGAPFIDGVQGRYFLPLVPMIAIAAATKREMPEWLAWTIVCVLVAVNGTAILRI
jgi:uncharacterized membrane protein